MINQILSTVLLVICLTGIVAYGTLAPWYRSVLGWSIMGLFVSLATATGALVSVYMFGQYEGRQQVFGAVYVLLIVVVGSIVANIIRYQLARRNP